MDSLLISRITKVPTLSMQDVLRIAGLAVTARASDVYDMAYCFVMTTMNRLGML